MWCHRNQGKKVPRLRGKELYRDWENKDSGGLHGSVEITTERVGIKEGTEARLEK